ncbi:MAG: accessory gene regulator B family protein [Lachnospiraceae bacterium]|nr:accessory gene regulator B family protein [Lachnospiraceae bacterium]
MSLTEKFANRIAVWSLPKDQEHYEEQLEVLSYGYVLFLENAYKTLALLIIAILTHTLIQTVIIIGSFVLVRGFAGGIHCKSGLGCTACMVLVWAVGLVMGQVGISLPVVLFMMLIIIGVIVKYAPKTTRNNPIRKEDIRKAKRRGAIISTGVLLGAGAVIGFGFGRMEILDMITASLFIESLSILLLVKKEEARHEEDEWSEGNSCQDGGASGI